MRAALEAAPAHPQLEPGLVDEARRVESVPPAAPELAASPPPISATRKLGPRARPASWDSVVWPRGDRTQHQEEATRCTQEEDRHNHEDGPTPEAAVTKLSLCITLNPCGVVADGPLVISKR